MRVLIIGAKGMLGQAMAEEFSDHEVLAWDREEINITNENNVKFQISNFKPDIVINCAAYTNVDKAEVEVELANAINGRAVGNLAAICKDLNIPIVHFSTEYVFDGENVNGYDETAVPNPVSTYGQSKFLGEQELQKNTEKYYLIRLSRMFGKETPSPYPLPQGERGGRESAPSRKKSFVQLMLELAEKQKQIEVVDEEVSSPTYAPDLARLARQIILQKLPYGIYHGANSGSCTWYEMATEVFKITGKDVKLIPVPGSRFPRKAQRPAHAILLNTKLPPQRDWKEALKDHLYRFPLPRE